MIDWTESSSKKNRIDLEINGCSLLVPEWVNNFFFKNNTIFLILIKADAGVKKQMYKIWSSLQITLILTFIKEKAVRKKSNSFEFVALTVYKAFLNSDAPVLSY